LIILIALLFTILAIILFIVWFNRNPSRFPPANNVIVSPADGTVIYVKEVKPGVKPTPQKFGRDIQLDELNGINLFSNGFYIIGIYLSAWDVHVTRAPISGRIISIRNKRGRLFSKGLFHLKTLDERSTCIIQGVDTTVGVVHMAAYLVRRIVLNVETCKAVRIGEPIGKIRLGSQVDLIISQIDRIIVKIKAGDRVRAGESIVAVPR
jgi:phosphatidylserine decarboxylase